MIKELDNTKAKKLLPLLNERKELNLFFIGDIESEVMDGKNVKLFVEEEKNEIMGVFLKYFDNFMVYMPKPMDYQKIVDLIEKENAKIISGERSSLSPLFPLLKGKIVREKTLYFSKLIKLEKFENGKDVEKASVKDAYDLIEMLSRIPEFRPQNTEAFISTMKNGTARRYFIRRNGKVVSTASTAAETKEMAMIVSVATLPQYRNHGFASKVVGKLCFDLLKEGKTPCLFYDNPTAGKIYERIGFRQMGFWQMFYLKSHILEQKQDKIEFL